jgi:hypothetical protein
VVEDGGINVKFGVLIVTVLETVSGIILFTGIIVFTGAAATDLLSGTLTDDCNLGDTDNVTGSRVEINVDFSGGLDDVGESNRLDEPGALTLLCCSYPAALDVNKTFCSGEGEDINVLFGLVYPLSTKVLESSAIDNPEFDRETTPG